MYYNSCRRCKKASYGAEYCSYRCAFFYLVVRPRKMLSHVVKVILLSVMCFVFFIGNCFNRDRMRND